MKGLCGSCNAAPSAVISPTLPLVGFFFRSTFASNTSVPPSLIELFYFSFLRAFCFFGPSKRSCSNCCSVPACQPALGICSIETTSSCGNLWHTRCNTYLPTLHYLSHTPSKTFIHPQPRLAMPESSTIIHIFQVISALFCLHAIYPKGITYGDKEDWETKAKARREANKQEERRRARREREREREGGKERGGRDYDDYEYRRTEKRGGSRNGQRRLKHDDEVRYIER